MLVSGTVCTSNFSPSCGQAACWTWMMRQSTDPTSGRSKGGSRRPFAVDRGRPGSKHPVIVDRHGTPLAVCPRNRPKRLFADRGYDYDKYRRLLWKRGIKPRIARRGVAHGSGLGRTRWVVERTFAWLHQFKRLRIRYERRADLHQGLLQLACSIICLRRLRKSF